MKINFDQAITNLDGKNVVSEGQDVVIKNIVSNTLCLATPKKKEDTIKQLNLAMKIYNSTEEIEVEDAEIKLIEDAMMQSQLTTLVLGQILKLIGKQ
jgi:predicted extracellular nuclease